MRCLVEPGLFECCGLQMLRLLVREQLVRKDLPFLARALTDQKVRFALLKGWRNYLCKARLEQAVIPGLYQVTLPETARAGLQDLLTAEGTLAFTVVPDATEGVIKPLTDEAFAFFNRYAPTLRPSSAAMYA